MSTTTKKSDHLARRYTEYLDSKPQFEKQKIRKTKTKKES